MGEKIIESKLAKLEEVLVTLKEFEEIPMEEFIADRKIFYGATYTLIMGIEIICDIGNHVLSYYFGRKAETYKDIIKLLAEVEVIPSSFAKETTKMTKFRNLAIHVYEIIKPRKVYSYMPQAISQFQIYSRYFLKFIQKP